MRSARRSRSRTSGRFFLQQRTVPRGWVRRRRSLALRPLLPARRAAARLAAPQAGGRLSARWPRAGAGGARGRVREASCGAQARGGGASSQLRCVNRSAVLQLAYASAATPSQRTSLYRELWGKDFALLGNRRRAQLALLGQPLTTDPDSPGTGAEHDSLGALFAADPSVKPRVLRQMEATLSKAARKGLAVTSIVQVGSPPLSHSRPLSPTLAHSRPLSPPLAHSLAHSLAHPRPLSPPLAQSRLISPPLVHRAARLRRPPRALRHRPARAARRRHAHDSRPLDRRLVRG